MPNNIESHIQGNSLVLVINPETAYPLNDPAAKQQAFVKSVTRDTVYYVLQENRVAPVDGAADPAAAKDFEPVKVAGAAAATFDDGSETLYKLEKAAFVAAFCL